MPRTEILVVTSNHSGQQLSPSLVSDPVNMNKMLNDGRTILVLSNRFGVTPVVFTIYTVVLIDGDLTVQHRAGTIAPGQVMAFGSFPMAIYNDPDGYVEFDTDTAIPVIAVSIG